jgi:DNA-binding GntR family transcriptional regulator
MNARPSSHILTAPALYEQVAERLRTRIFAHELPPGGWIDEQALALEYGISRTPLREALKVLAAEGLVILKPRRGCYVTQLSEQDIDEVFPVMALLEGQGAAEAARRVTRADFARLAAIHAELERHARRTQITSSSQSALPRPCRKSPATATWRN